MTCNLCGSADAAERFPDTRADASQEPAWTVFCCTSPDYGVHPPIVECSQCGLVYAHPRPSAEVLRDRYTAVEDPLYLRERRGRELTFARHLRAFERHTGLGSGHRLLDVGAYIGVFVEAAASAGWDAWGLEPSRWGASKGTERGLNMVQGTLAEKPFEQASFDAVTLWDVIEHLDDPLATLRQAREVLRPGGWIAVHTMDLGSLTARLMGHRWPWFMEMHLYYFTRRTLTRMLAAAGFADISVRSQGRYLRLAYLTTRIAPFSSRLAGVLDRIARATRLDKVAVPVNLGDLITAYARKDITGSGSRRGPVDRKGESSKPRKKPAPSPARGRRGGS